MVEKSNEKCNNEEPLKFWDCFDIPHLTLEELNNINDGEIRPLFIVRNWLGDIHTSKWQLYYGKASAYFLMCGIEGVTSWNGALHRIDSYEKDWIAFSEKPENIPFNY